MNMSENVAGMGRLFLLVNITECALPVGRWKQKLKKAENLRVGSKQSSIAKQNI